MKNFIKKRKILILYYTNSIETINTNHIPINLIIDKVNCENS